MRDRACSFLRKVGTTAAGEIGFGWEPASAVVSTGPRTTPWRLIMIGRTAGTLIESDLMWNLAAPSRIEDTSWIRPGITAWDKWWSRGGYGTLEDDMKFVDLAADMGWPYMLVDRGWMKVENGTIKPAWDIGKLAAYATGKHVRPLLWIHSKELNAAGIEKTFAYFASLGAAGAKIDFMDRSDQEIVRWYEEVPACAAKYKLPIHFHGAYVPTGLARTWPNYITQEGGWARSIRRPRRNLAISGIRSCSRSPAASSAPQTSRPAASGTARPSNGS